MPVKNPIDCFKKYGVKDLSTQLQKRIEEGANPYEAAREIIVAEHRRLHETTNEIRALGKLKKLPYAEQKDISQQIKQLNEAKTSAAANQPIQQTATEPDPQVKETVTEPTPTGTTEAGQVGAGRTPPVLKSRKGIVNKARDIEDLTDPRDIVMQYFVGGNRINSSAIKELFGGKDDRLHFSKGTKGEYQSRISLIKSDAPSIKELAHQLWENSGGLEEGYNYTDRDFRDAIEAVLKDHNSPASMATELVDRYVNAAVKEDLTEAEAKQINDGLIADLQKYVTDLPENQQNELLSLLSKYQDKYGFVDWAKLEQDTNGFEPEILSLPTQTQEALDGIIQKNIQSGQGELSNTSRQDSSQKENQEKIIAEGAATVPVEPPAEPPKTPPAAGGEQGGSRKKGILNRLYEAKNVPQAAKEGFERAGLDYETASQEEAAKVAKAVVEEFGIDEAVTMAEAQKFDGDVNSLIFAESLNSLSEQIDAVATEAEKVELAKKFAEVAITYDKMGRVKAGRFNAAINYFYKKSPLGVVFYENANRADGFAQFSKGKEKSWQETYDELKQNPEFAKLFKEEVSGEVETKLKEERKSARATRIEKVRDVFKSAKEKFRKEGGGTYSTIIPPHVMETVLEAMELAYEAGEAALKIIEDAVKAISDKIGNDWDKDKFRKEWETKLSDGKKKALTDEELKERVIEKFRKKMKGLSDKQKEEVIRKSYRKLIENGALDHDDFKKIIAEVTGRGELTEAEAKKMKELTQKTNDLEVAAKKWRDEKTKDAQVGFTKAQIEAAQANKELQDMFYNKPDIIKRLTSIMQLSTLGIPALVNNPIYNLWNQMALRFPVGLINDLLDRGIAAAARIGGKNYQKEYNIIAAQKGFFETLGVGGKEAVEQIFTGLNRQDYLQKELYGQQLRPFRAIRDLIAYKQGKKKLTSRQIVDKTLQASVGIPAEVVARLLNIGDKPMRFGAEGGTAAQFAKTLGLQGMDFDLFVNFPREEAYRVYKGMGLSDEVAGQKADYVKAAIMKEGMRSTFQQDNLANEGLTRLFSILGGKESGTANLAKVLTISPYVKIPLNAGWSTYNLINPEVAILQAFVHGGRAWKLARSGKTTDSQLALREARYWFGHAIVGVATRAVVLALIGSGRFSPGSDEDETKKKRDARFYFDKPGTIEVGGQKIADRWFGQFGAVKNAIAKRYYDSTPEQREKQQEFWNIVFGGMELEGLQEFQNSVFANTSALAQVLETGNPDRYITNTINMFTNIIQPASWAQMERAALDEVPTSRGDNLLDKINQEFAKRSTVYRQITGTDIYKKRDIWGNRMPKGGNIISRAFGISKANPQLPARPMFDDYLRTGDSGFLPPAVLPTIDGQKLNQDQYDRLQKYIGNERQHLTEPFVAGDVVTKVTKKYYKDMTDDEKKDYLNALYTEGRIRGTEKFYTDYPQFRPKEKSIKKQVSDVLQNADLELMKIKDK